MSTVSCTFNGFYTFNNGWTWLGAPSGYGYDAMGIDSAGRYRYFVMKVTTSNFASNAGRSIAIFFSWATTNSGAVGNRTIVYSLNTTAPPSSGGGGASADNAWYTARNTELAYGSSDWWLSVASNTSSSGGYSYGGITINSTAIKPNTTYYIWMYCGISNTKIYVGNTSVTGQMSAKNTYAAYVAPSLSKSSVGGYYGGITWSVGANSGYPYVYMGWSPSGTFYKKTTNASSCSISTDADTSSTSIKTLYIFRSDTDLGSSSSSPGSGYLTSRTAYRFGAYIYNGSSTRQYCEWSSGNPVSYSGWNLQGFTTSSSSYSVSYNSDQINGKTVYAIYYKGKYTESSTTRYWYRGTSSRNSLTRYYNRDYAYLYGAGQQAKGGGSYSYSSTPATSCAANSSYTLVGWTSSSSSTSAQWTNIYTAWESAATIYGIYKYQNGDAYTEKSFYRGSSTRQSIGRTYSYDPAYYYGAGSYTGGGQHTSYSYSGTSCLSNSNYSLAGWTASSTSTSVQWNSLTAAFEASDGPFYGIYKYQRPTSTTSKTFYTGSSTPQTISKTYSYSLAYYYGTGLNSGGACTPSWYYPSIVCADRSYALDGWSESPTATSRSWSSITTAFDSSSSSTLYGIYSKIDVMTVYPQNGQDTIIKSTNNYCYGTGSKTNNRPSAPSLTRDNYSFVGWSSSASGATSAWNTLWDNGIRTVYAIWKVNIQFYYGINGAWKICKIYYGVNGAWKPVEIVRYGTGGSWKSS